MHGCGGVHALSLSGQDFALYKHFKKIIIVKYVVHYLHSYPWNETVECNFYGLHL